METEIYKFDIGKSFDSIVMNGDYEGHTDEEIDQWESFEARFLANLPDNHSHGHWKIENENENENFTLCEVSCKFDDCSEIIYISFIKKGE